MKLSLREEIIQLADNYIHYVGISKVVMGISYHQPCFQDGLSPQLTDIISHDRMRSYPLGVRLVVGQRSLEP